jgi:hypothetical protein
LRLPAKSQPLRLWPAGDNRRNWLLCWSDVGADVFATIHSLLASRCPHQLHRYDHLVVQRMDNHPIKEVDQLIPRRWEQLFADYPLHSDRNNLDAHVIDAQR